MQWKFTHLWEGIPPYSFNATIDANGIFTVDGQPEYRGVFKQMSDEVSLAAMDSKNNSISTFVGNRVARIMGGEARGLGASGKAVTGIWFAIEVELASAEPKPFHLP